MCNLIFLSFWGENVADYAFRTLEDRQKIEKLREDGRTPKEISETRGVPVHVDYNEMTRGQDGPTCRTSACGTARTWPSAGCRRRWSAGTSGPGSLPAAARRRRPPGDRRTTWRNCWATCPALNYLPARERTAGATRPRRGIGGKHMDQIGTRDPRADFMTMYSCHRQC